MKRSDPTHPSHDDLFAYLAGKMNAVDSESIETHLNHCESCCEALSAVPSEDTIDSMLRPKEADTSVSPETPSAQDDPRSESGIAPTIVHESDEETRAPRGEVTAVPGLDTDELKLPPELRDHPRYKIVELLGHGGMGDVYRAEHRVMNRQVALKVIKPQLVQSDAAVKRFQREVHAAARLEHPNIVTAFDAEQAGDLHYLVMSFVDGVDLDQVVRERGPLPVEEACEYIRQTAEGLQHANDLGMVHRDIKPHNLMIEVGQASSLSSRSADKLEAYPTLKILDFGLANFANETAAEEIEEADPEHHAPAAEVLHQLTQMGTMMGTPDYIAPEQAQDAHTADIRSDIYSLGCTFYTLLAGHAPFGEGSVLDKVRAHTEKDAPPISDFRDDVPAEIETVLQKMMAKNPADRYQTPAEVAEALVAVGRIVNPSMPSDGRIVNPSYRRRRPLVLTAVATLFLAVIAAVVFYIQTNNGVVRVEVTDPSLNVTLNGQTISVDDNGKPLTIRAGEQKLIVRQNDSDFELVTDSFQLRRGDDIALKVDLLPGEVVVSKDGQRLSDKRLPESETESTENTVVVSVTKIDSDPMIRLEGNVVKNQKELFDRLVVMAEKNRRLVVRLEGDLDLHSKDFEELHKLIYQSGVLMVKLPPELQREARTIAENQVFWAKERLIRSNNLAEIGKALHNYHDTNQQFPPARFGDRAEGFDENGRPLLSWRVHLLPYVSEDGPELYNQFNLDEPWDSQHNLKLLDQMPDVYKTTTDPVKSALQDPRKTTYLAVVGEGTAYEGKAGLKAADITAGDGMSNTVYIVDAGRERAVPWTKPEDLPFDREDPIRAFGTSDIRALVKEELSGDVFLALMADTSVQSIPYDTAPESLRALFTRAGGDSFEPFAKRTTPLPLPKQDEFALVRKFEGLESPVYQIAWSPDGQRAISISEGVACFWDIASGRLLNTSTSVGPGSKSASNRYEAMVSPDGRHAVVRGAKVTLWDMESHEFVKTLLEDPGSGDEFDSVAFSPDGRLLSVSASRSAPLPRRLRVFGTEDWNELYSVNGSRGGDFSPDSRWVFTGRGNNIALLDARNGQLVRTFSELSGGPVYGFFSPDGSLLAAEDSTYKSPRVWETETGKLLTSWSADEGAGIMAIFANNTRILTNYHGSAEQAVRDLKTGKVLVRLQGHRGRIPSTRVLPDERHAITGSFDETIRIWNLTTGKEVFRVDTPGWSGTNLSISPDGRSLLSGGGYLSVPRGEVKAESFDIRLWQLPESVWPQVKAEEIPLDRKFGGRVPVKGLEFLSDTHALTIAGGTSTGSLPELHVWDLEAGRVEVAIPLPFDVRTAAVSADHKFVLVAENKQGPGAHRVARFNLDIFKLSPEEFAEQAEKVWVQSLIPQDRKSYEIQQLKLEPAWTISLEQATEELKCFQNGEAFLVRDHRGRVALYRSEDGGFVSELAAAKVEAMSLAPDGRLLLVKHDQGGAHLMRAEDGFKVNELNIAATSRVTATDWCADGRCVVTADAGGQINVWNLATGEAVHSFSTGGEPIANVLIGSNRQRIYTSSERGVAVWDLTGRLLARGEAPPFSETSLGLSPDQKTLLSGGQSWQTGASKDDHSLRLWQLPESVWPQE